MNRDLYGKLVFELSHPGRRALKIDSNNCPAAAPLPASLLRDKPLELPQVDEPTLVRHYHNMSTNNFGVDTGFYPLGSCTMKYNPRINEEMAAHRLFAGLHPYQPESTGSFGSLLHPAVRSKRNRRHE